MMRIDIISAQPGMFGGFLSESIIGRAEKKGLCEIDIVDLRKYGIGRWRKVDDKPYGGGPGMLMRCEPWFAAVEAVARPDSRIIMTTPAGKRFTQEDAILLSKEEHLVFMCGHYEGFDARIETLATDKYSIGDFVMTGGELAAAAMADSIVRLIPGALGAGIEATRSETFSCDGGMLEHAQYTHPVEFRGMKVPDVLVNGDHSKIDSWRRASARERTMKERPDLCGS